MTSRRKFLQQGCLGFLSTSSLPLYAFAHGSGNFTGLVVNEDEGEAFQMRDGTAIVKIKIAKIQGVQSISFLSESFKPGDSLPVHKHLKEDELIFLHKVSGLFTLGDKQFDIQEGAVALVPKGVWHGLQNTGKEILKCVLDILHLDLKVFSEKLEHLLDNLLFKGHLRKEEK